MLYMPCAHAVNIYLVNVLADCVLHPIVVSGILEELGCESTGKASSPMLLLG